ncbi:MAG: GntR family transcriptional regulator [Proteobacteria bacterium]|nr:GntR family transcriptional regulator [Pseudomonadota bacterium]
MDKTIEIEQLLGATHTPLAKLVAAAIRDRITSGEFSIGSRLVEGKLSEELGVSRMPVREALRELAAEGLVTIEPRRGASVTAVTDDQKRDMIEVRATLEALNARLAARRHDPEQIARLQLVLDEGGKITETGSRQDFIRQNDRFHEALADVGGNSVLTDMMRSLRDRTAMLFAPTSQLRARENWQEHAAILRAVIDGDSELAALLAARHVYNAAQMKQDV